jgi:hypothetical protein
MTGLLRHLGLLATSAATGCVVGTIVTGAAAAFSGAGMLAAVTYGAPAGTLIGLAACVAFLGLSTNAGRRPVLSFLAVGPIVAAGTAAANSVAGMPAGGLSLTVIVASVALAYLATFLWYRSYRRWNDRLRAFQRATNHPS